MRNAGLILIVLSAGSLSRADDRPGPRRGSSSSTAGGSPRSGGGSSGGTRGSPQPSIVCAPRRPGDEDPGAERRRQAAGPPQRRPARLPEHRPLLVARPRQARRQALHPQGRPRQPRPQPLQPAEARPAGRRGPLAGARLRADRPRAVCRARLKAPAGLVPRPVVADEPEPQLRPVRPRPRRRPRRGHHRDAQPDRRRRRRRPARRRPVVDRARYRGDAGLVPRLPVLAAHQPDRPRGGPRGTTTAPGTMPRRRPSPCSSATTAWPARCWRGARRGSPRRSGPTAASRSNWPAPRRSATRR